MAFKRSLPLLVLLSVLYACTPPEPIRIGFIGGLSGRVADLGEGGRNGAQLAIEEKNRAGGLGGRQLELIVRDNGQTPEQAKQATRELLASGVIAVIGPMTSGMADSVLSVTEPAHIVTVGPTVTARKFSGHDDYFFLITPSTKEEARLGAEYHAKKNKIRHVVAISDHHNREYTDSWRNDFENTLQRFGGTVGEVAFDSSRDADYAGIVKQVIAQKPDGILLLCSAVDAGRLAQQIRMHNSKIPILSSMWAGTEKLVEMGGVAVEGLTLHQYFDRLSTEPSYLDFKARFNARFKQMPGFPGIAGYDAAQVILQSLERRTPSMSLKQALLETGPFAGVQGEVRFNAQGDNQRLPHIAVVRHGQFVMAE